LLLLGSTAQAATLWVHCGSKTGLNSISAALKVLHSSEESHAPSTINVSGACYENVVIQSLDQLTLNAAPGASITDTSSGALDVIDVLDSNDVAITGFTVNGGSSGIFCGDGSLCRLTNDTVQGTISGGGISVFSLSRARVTGVTLRDNAIGLQVGNGGAVVGDATMPSNYRGIHMVTGAVVNITANITQSQELGIFGTTNATLNCNSCVITDNAGGGVLLRQSSSARFTPGFTITGNGGPGVALSELSSALLQGGTATGNAGGTDVLCGPQFTSARGATDIGGGHTNCVEPSP
jgi:hypothetical protein